MKPEDYICVCNRVPLSKLQKFLKRQNPAVASQLSECLGAGTSCGWCIPFLEKLHRQQKAGEELGLQVPFESYVDRRAAYKARKSSHEFKDD